MPVRESTLARQLAGVGSQNLHQEAKTDVAFIHAHCKHNAKYAQDIKRMIKAGQVRMLRGEKPLVEDKPVNNNLNKIANMSVGLMMSAILEGTEGVVTAIILSKMRKKNPDNLRRLYKFLVAEDGLTPIAPGSTQGSVHKYNILRICAVGQRYKKLVLLNDGPHWAACSTYYTDEETELVVIVHRWSDLKATLVNELTCLAWNVMELQVFFDSTV